MWKHGDRTVHRKLGRENNSQLLNDNSFVEGGEHKPQFVALFEAASDPLVHQGAKSAVPLRGIVAEPRTRRLVAPDGTEVALTTAEFSLLMAFPKRSGKMLSRNQLLDITQGRDADRFKRSIDVLTTRRPKLNDTDKQQLLKSKRTGGYPFTARFEYVGPLK